VKEYRYAIVQSDGISHDLWPSWEDYQQLDEVETDDYEVWAGRATLPQLLAQGWRPVRETSMGGSKDVAFALVLLERGEG
jgi:hypothetical protein